MLGTGFRNLEKWIDSYIRVKQGQRKYFSDCFLQRLTKAVQIGVTNPETRPIFIESLAFENANLEFKKFLGPLKARTASIEEWIVHIMNVETLDYSLKFG